MVTVARIAFVPVLWWWALQGHTRSVGIGVLISFLSDIADGQLARRMNQVTRLGSQLDTVADALVLASSVGWLVMLRPEVLEQPYATVLAVGLGTWLLEITIGLVRFRRFLNLHLYSGKANGVVGTLFMADAFALGFHAWTFYAALGVFALSNLEGVAVMLTRPRVDEHIGSILRRPVSAVTCESGAAHVAL
jgi:CDP-diacylglycerol--glycerol-3-phosphate 3-phosphatidyltransferase